MKLKIYIENKPVYLADEIDKEISSLKNSEETLCITLAEFDYTNTLDSFFKNEEKKVLLLIYPNIIEVKEKIFSNYTVVVAGGGLVKNEIGEYLFIFRKGMWDLPKGKLDEGEAIEECALREVMEETGLKNVKMTSPLTITYHTYFEKQNKILKQSHWYAMEASSQENISPQLEEGITEIKWIAPKFLNTLLRDIYPSIKDVLLTEGLTYEEQ